MTGTRPFLSWRDFRRRLDRTRAPAAPPPVLKFAAGPQLYLARREGTPSSNSSNRTVVLEVSNVGLEKARVRAEVRNPGGKKIGRILPHRHEQLAPGERRKITFRPTQPQWKTLLGGGSLVLFPGDLPEAWRTFRFRSAPAFTCGSLEWEIPVPHTGVFELVAGEGRVAKVGTFLDVQTADRHPLVEGAPLETLPEGGSLALLLPYEEVRYRFRCGRESFRDPHNPAFAAPPEDDWSLRAPRFLQRAWNLPSVSFPIVGRPSTSHPDRLKVRPEWIEVEPGQEQSLALELHTDWLAEWKSAREVVKVHLVDADSQRQRDLLNIALVRRRFTGPALHLIAPPPHLDEVPVRNRGGRWCIDLTLDNPGSEQAEAYLQVGDTYRSAKVKVPPTPFPAPVEMPTFCFDLSDEVAKVVSEAANRKDPLRAKLMSDGRVFWDPETITFRPRLVPLSGSVDGGETQISLPGDLRWEIGEREGADGEGEDETRRRVDTAVGSALPGWFETVRLVLKHRGPRSVIAKEGVIFKNGFPFKSLSLFTRCLPGEEIILFEERIRTGWFRPIALRALVTLAVGAEIDRKAEIDRRAALRLQRGRSPEVETDADSGSSATETENGDLD